LVLFVQNIVWFGVRGFTGASLGDFSRLFGIYTDRSSWIGTRREQQHSANVCLCYFV